jgi:two-component system nitrate/nitrite response regulator NarL
MADFSPAPSSKVQNSALLSSNLVKLPIKRTADVDSPVTPIELHTRQAISIVIAQNETICRESLRILLQGEAAFNVVDSCPDGERSLILTRKIKPDVLLLDIGIPQHEGIDVLRQLKECEPDVKVVLLCQSITKEDTVRFLQLGVRGIVLKTEPTDSLFECIQKVAKGEFWLGTDGIMTLVQSLVDHAKSKGTQQNKYGLTPREIEIIQAVLEAYTNPEIAVQFSLSEQTVKHHLSHIFDKLGVYSRLELALFAVNHDVNSE